jgi:hypothetical protein
MIEWGIVGKVWYVGAIKDKMVHDLVQMLIGRGCVEKGQQPIERLTFCFQVGDSSSTLRRKCTIVFSFSANWLKNVHVDKF